MDDCKVKKQIYKMHFLKKYILALNTNLSILFENEYKKKKL